MFILDPEPENTILEEITDWIPDINISKWSDFDRKKLAQIAGAILALIGVTGLVKLFSDWLMDSSRNIKLLDYMDTSLYRKDKDGNWSMGCPMGDNSSQSVAGSSIVSKNSSNMSRSYRSRVSSATRSSRSS